MFPFPFQHLDNGELKFLVVSLLSRAFPNVYNNRYKLKTSKQTNNKLK